MAGLFLGADEDAAGEEGVVGFEFVPGHVLDGESGEEGEGEAEVSPGFDPDVVGGEVTLEDDSGEVGGESPVVARDVLFLAIDFAQGGESDEHDAAGLEDSFHVAEGAVEVVDVLERLGADEAVVGLVGDGMHRPDVVVDVGEGVGGGDVEDVGLGDVLATELSGVVGVFDLEDPALDVGLVSFEELLDESTVDGRAAVGADEGADGTGGVGEHVEPSRSEESLEGLVEDGVRSAEGSPGEAPSRVGVDWRCGVCIRHVFGLEWLMGV